MQGVVSSHPKGRWFFTHKLPRRFIVRHINIFVYRDIVHGIANLHGVFELLKRSMGISVPSIKETPAQRR
jgi:hypothetical protein